MRLEFLKGCADYNVEELKESYDRLGKTNQEIPQFII